MNVYFFSMNIPLFSWLLLCCFILFPYQVIDRLTNGILSTEVKSMEKKTFNRYKQHEMEEYIQKVREKMLEEFPELQQQAADNIRVIPSSIAGKLIVIFSI